MSNYPDDLSDGTPGAPWNQTTDYDPVICDACDHEVDDPAEDLVGEPCVLRFTPDEVDPYKMPGCAGTYRSQRCSECGHVNCGCP